MQESISGVILAFFFLITSTAHSEPVLTYKNALKQVIETSPEVHIQSLYFQKEVKVLQQSSSLVQTSPEIELSYEKGKTQYPIGYFDTIPSAEEMKSQSYEIGIKQQLEINGARQLRINESTSRKAIAEKLLELEKLQARSRLRQDYLSISIHKEMMDHLNEHVIRFVRMRSTFGNGYFDRRLGNYTMTALDMGITSLKASLTETSTEHDKSILEMKRQLGLLNSESNNNTNIEIEDFQTIPFAELPDKNTLISDAKNGLMVLLNQDRIDAESAAQQIANRKILPFVELFAATGKRNLGNYSSVSFQNNVAERENYFKFGLRIPIGLWGAERYESNIKEIDQKIAEQQLLQLQDRLTSQIINEITTYESQRQSFNELHRSFRKSEPLLHALESALIARRITYFEFWSEHERLHEILARMGQTRLDAAATLGRLEILTGKTLE